MSKVHFILYTSFRNENCTEEEIDKILEASQRNNAELGITGILIHSKFHFIQYIEGDFKSVYELYNKIKLDNRHKDVDLVQMAETSERIFPQWFMGSKNIDTDKLELDGKMLSETSSNTLQAILDKEKVSEKMAIEFVKSFYSFM